MTTRMPGAAALAALALATAAGVALADTPPAPPAPPAPPVKLCIASVGEARYRNYGYDHVVRLTNACDVQSECSVTTDVNPAAAKATVPGGQTVEVLTFRGSPAASFTHRAVCTPP
jgi:hypothetical protein